MAESKLYLGEELWERFDTANALYVAFERLKLQVDKESDKRRRSKKGDLVKEFAELLNVAGSTIGNWTSTERIPARVEEIEFVSLVYLLARRTRELDANWLVDVFRNSDRELPDNPSEHDIRELFRLARINHQPVSEAEIDVAIGNLLEDTGKRGWSGSQWASNGPNDDKQKRDGLPLPPAYPEKRKRDVLNVSPRYAALVVIAVLLLGSGGLASVLTARGDRRDKPAIHRVDRNWCTTQAAHVGQVESTGSEQDGWLYVSTQVKLDDYYVYFDDEYVGPDSLQLQGVDTRRDDWRFRIHDEWRARHPEWEDEMLWRIDFYCS